MRFTDDLLHHHFPIYDPITNLDLIGELMEAINDILKKAEHWDYSYIIFDLDKDERDTILEIMRKWEGDDVTDDEKNAVKKSNTRL